MKKIIFSLALVALGLTGCTSFDDEHSEKYADGPAVALSLVTTQDSCFTFTVKPEEGTQYYSYAVTEDTEAADMDAATLLKDAIDVQIDGASIKYATQADTTVNMRNAKDVPLCKPNTSYVIYAVAANDKGMTGKVATLVVKTSDGNAPVVVDYDSGDSIAVAQFSEKIYRGEGALSCKYYAEWDVENPVTVPEEDIEWFISGSDAYFTVANLPAGAYVFFSWEEGAFVDSYGNKCPAMNSDFNWETGEIAGCGVHNTQVAWDILDEYVISPDSGSLIANYKDFKGVIKLPENVYRNDAFLETGDFSVIYTSSKKTSVVGLDADEWSVSGNTVTFTLPEAPAAGDIITVKIAKNVLFDVYGNGNNAYESTNETRWWKYFAMTKDMALGSFTFTTKMSSGNTYDFGTVTITEDPDRTNGLIIKDLFLEGSEVGGYYDLAAGEIYIDAYSVLGIYENTYGTITYSLSGKTEIPFTVNADGTITSTDFCVVACDTEYKEALGYLVKPTSSIFTPAASGAKASYKARKVKLSVK